jgi:hypothetical protein
MRLDFLLIIKTGSTGNSFIFANYLECFREIFPLQIEVQGFCEFLNSQLIKKTD